jgi:hypothetical protein
MGTLPRPSLKDLGHPIPDDLRGKPKPPASPAPPPPRGLMGQAGVRPGSSVAGSVRPPQIVPGVKMTGATCLFCHRTFTAKCLDDGSTLDLCQGCLEDSIFLRTGYESVNFGEFPRPIELTLHANIDPEGTLGLRWQIGVALARLAAWVIGWRATVDVRDSRIKATAEDEV